MNERIEKLAEQAMTKAVAKNFTGDKLELRMPSEAWVKEFAELFLDECVDTMVQYGLLEDHGEWLREKLSEKFGFQNKKSQDELKPTPYPYLPTYINPRYSSGCPVCGIGKNNTATGYVCHRDDCPTKITC